MSSAQNASFEEQQESKFVSEKRTNVKSDLIEITQDKVENIILKYLKNINIRNSWQTPFATLLTLFLARLTASFKDALGLSKDSWNAFFAIGIVISFFWLIWTIYKIVVYWNYTSIEYLINRIKNAEDNPK